MISSKRLTEEVNRALVSLDAGGSGSPVRRLCAAVTAIQVPDRSLTALAVRAAAQQLAELIPGRTVELRVPPYAAVQLDDGTGGPVHKRGTPPAVVETDPHTFLALVSGTTTWEAAAQDRKLRYSGTHADLSDRFPLA